VVLVRLGGADRAGQVLIENDIGYSYAMLGDYQRALTYCERSLAGLQELGEHDAADAVLDSLGYIHHRLGDHEKAIACYQRSVELCRERAGRSRGRDWLVTAQPAVASLRM
jgi:tetratricopeptide (TPR) repeat protein